MPGLSTEVNMETQSSTFIAKVFGTIITGFCGAFGLGKYNANIVKKPELYQKDGQPIYLTISQSKENILDCRNTMSTELTGIEIRLDKISESLNTQNAKDVVNAKLAGAFEQYMRDHPK